MLQTHRDWQVPLLLDVATQRVDELPHSGSAIRVVYALDGPGKNCFDDVRLVRTFGPNSTNNSPIDRILHDQNVEACDVPICDRTLRRCEGERNARVRHDNESILQVGPRPCVVQVPLLSQRLRRMHRNQKV